MAKNQSSSGAQKKRSAPFHPLFAVSFTFKLDLKDCIDVALQLHTNKMPTYLLFCPLPLVKEQGICKLDLKL